jgi:hypothetical protein
MQMQLRGTAQELSHLFSRIEATEKVTASVEMNGHVPVIVDAEVVNAKRHISAAGRRAMQLAQKKRWAKVKKKALK